MGSKKQNHDTLVYRLAQILIKLNQGEKLEPQTLADEFGVNLRTIQRDLNERFAYLPLIKTEGKYHLDGCFLGNITNRDIKHFAALAGIKGLFPALNDAFFRDIFDSRLQSAILVHGHHYEKLDGKQELFRLLELAIVDHRQISFDYDSKEGPKTYSAISPYKLINVKGIWYLVACDNERLKTFSFAKIGNCDQHETRFVPDPEVNNKLASEEGIWFSEAQHKVVLKVDAEIAGYFKRRNLIANQVLEKELENGDLLVSTLVGHLNQVIPIVRYWIPHISIVSPDGLQAQINNELNKYIRSFSGATSTDNTGL